MDSTVAPVVAVWAVCALLSAVIAARRGMPVVTHFIGGAVLGPLGVLYALIAKPVEPVRFE